MTNPPPLIDPAALAALLRAGTESVLPCDCSFDLADPGAGRRAYEAGHLPGAAYFDLDRDLSAAKNGRNGRHPLPARADFVARLGAAGVDAQTLLVAYDDAGGAYAARLWWLALWVGHERVCLLDGGIAAWRAAHGAVETGAPRPCSPAALALRPPRVASVDYPTLRAGPDSTRRLIVDARAPERFRGESETLDPVAGHIPGAVNRCFRDNLGSDGRFKPAAQLRAEWLALMAGRQPSELVQQCGSGVSACHNLLAMAVAGLPGSLLYPGSWSEWCAQPDAPVATGE